MVRFLVVGDLHGRKPVIRDKNFDAIICPGDIASDKGIAALWRKYFAYLKKTKGENLGFEDFAYSKIGKKKYKEYEKYSLKRGREILKYLNSFGKPVFVVPGNWDQSYGKTRINNLDKSYYHHYKAFLDFYLGDSFNSKMVKGLKNIVDCQYNVQEFMGIDIVGYGLSSGPENPKLKTKHKFSREEKGKLIRAHKKILNKLRKVYSKRKNPSIFISHNVPYNTKLDKVINKKSYAHGKHLGSSVARWFCERFKPVVCVCGHIHEHHGKCKIGSTTVINAGFGGKVNTYFDVINGKVKNLRFYDG